MKFKVHNDLKNYPKALKKLSKSSDDDHFSEALQLIKKQRLYKVALDFYQGQDSRLSTIREAFGDYLEQRGFLEEAGSMFLAASALEKSQATFIKSLNVEMSLAVLAKRNLNEQES